MTEEDASENTEEVDIDLYPDNANLTTDTGEQVESEIVLMEGIDGKFFGKVKKGDRLGGCLIL